MKRPKRLLMFIFVFVFVSSMVMPSLAFADPKNTGKGKGNLDQDVKAVERESKAQKGEVEQKEEKTKVNETLEKQPTDKAPFAKLDKEEKQKIKAEIKSNYSAEELQKLQAEAQQIEEDNSDVDVPPIDSIVVKGKKIKWDMPPVVKSGRVLVPVRALTQAYGAEVEWNQEEQKVTITKDGKEIVIELNSKTVYVNGVAVELDVPAQSINSRTVVPLRFITEQLGLKVNWDDETDTVEIGEDEETDEDIDEEEDVEEVTEEDTDSTDDATDTEDTAVQTTP